MKKVYALAPQEDWIVDRFVKEFNEDNLDIACNSPEQSDVIWLMADWCYRQIDPRVLDSKKVLTTIHHIVPEKFGIAEHSDFTLRDHFTSAYHVPNKHTEAFIKPLTQKPIHVIPYWANQRIWWPSGEKHDLRKKHGLPVDGYLVGSFQRDTEGHDLKSPKLEKGPDLLIDYVETLQREWDLYAPTCGYTAMRRPHMVLAGWRRQYVISRLEAAEILHTYFEKPDQPTLNELYQCLDLYPVASRHEGGPQSLIECGLLKIPVVSRDIGMASQILPVSAINDCLIKATPTIPNIEKLKLPSGYQPYRELIEAL